MDEYLDYNGIQEFLQKVKDAPIVEDPDYILGLDNGKIVKMVTP